MLVFRKILRTYLMDIPYFGLKALCKKTHNNCITATQFPGILNEEADIESRKHETRTEWMINQKYFKKIIKRLNFRSTVDLFATRLNTQLPRFISLRSDPESK